MYETEYQKEKAEYDQKMEEYKKTQKDVEKPKKPMSAYMLFANAKRAEIKAANPGNLFKRSDE